MYVIEFVAMAHDYNITCARRSLRLWSCLAAGHKQQHMSRSVGSDVRDRSVRSDRTVRDVRQLEADTSVHYDHHQLVPDWTQPHTCCRCPLWQHCQCGLPPEQVLLLLFTAIIAVYLVRNLCSFWHRLRLKRVIQESIHFYWALQIGWNKTCNVNFHIG